MVHLVVVLAHGPGNLGSIPRSHMVAGKSLGDVF